jgi:hypothetical protein
MLGLPISQAGGARYHHIPAGLYTSVSIATGKATKEVHEYMWPFGFWGKPSNNRQLEAKMSAFIKIIFYNISRLTLSKLHMKYFV